MGFTILASRLSHALLCVGSWRRVSGASNCRPRPSQIHLLRPTSQNDTPDVTFARTLSLVPPPRPAGKSTVLRSVAAAALLATCGMAVPAGAGEAHHTTAAAAAAMPAGSSAAPPPAGSGSAAGGPLAAPYPLEVSWLSHVSLRNFSGDSPLEGKSAFAVEMEDTA